LPEPFGERHLPSGSLAVAQEAGTPGGSCQGACGSRRSDWGAWRSGAAFGGARDLTGRPARGSSGASGCRCWVYAVQRMKRYENTYYYRK
jgi:hypothetical protein